MPFILNNQQVIERGKRLPEVDELKGLALILVLLYHIGGVLNWENEIHGEIGVDLFLILSGFTLCLTARAMPAKSFVLRRMFRILPSYWAALLLFSVLNTLIQRPPSVFSFLVHVFCVQGFVGRRYFLDINDSFWFISLIVLVYIVFILTRRYLGRPDLILAIGCFLTVGVATGYVFTHHLLGVTHLACRIPSFFIGLIGGVYLTQRATEIRPSLILLLGVICLALLSIVTGPLFITGLIAAFIIIIYLWVRRVTISISGTALGARLLSVLGVFSYEIYLLHQPLIRNVNFYILTRLDLAGSRFWLQTGVVIGLLVSFAAAVLLHLAVNRAFRASRAEKKVAAG